MYLLTCLLLCEVFGKDGMEKFEIAFMYVTANTERYLLLARSLSLKATHTPAFPGGV